MDSTQERPAKRKKTQKEDADGDHQLNLILSVEVNPYIDSGAPKSRTEGKPIRKNNGSTVANVPSLEADLNNLKQQSPNLITHSCFQDLRDSSEAVQLTWLKNKISSQKLLAEMIKQTVSKLLIQPHSGNHVHPQVREASSSGPEFRDHKHPSSGHQSCPRAGSNQAVARELADLEGRSNGAGGSDPESNASKEDDDNNDNNDGSSKTEPQLSSKGPKLSKPKPTTRPLSSTFLPALNVGYTLGNSDASDVDIDDLAVDKMERERGRKNWRGQQARRASKKYGNSAKHLVKLKQNHVPKQQKPGGSHRAKLAGPQRDSFTGKRPHTDGQPTGSNTEPIAATKGAADPKLHPSWIAKQN
ncbi:hypothetical protein PCANC_10629 [Puccinia coronata f. sp. avenae]|uniref:Bud22 domain-containing protein n=1 Tax=Puccinia coronata f. sp. avenae TaxID=200324 RepID=A0A2N5V3Z6_9BASI|nr:hypothetical protein PCANC_10629 [Puccinia coronata f. sp. avenae]